MNAKFSFCTFLLLFLATITATAQYSYKEQKDFIHSNLGKVYLGMPLTEFAQIIDLSASDAGANRYNHLALEIPLNKGNIKDIVVKAEGVPYSLQKEIISKINVERTGDYGTYTATAYRIDTTKIPEDAFVYQISVFFKPEYDLKKYVFKTFGEKSGTHHNEADEYKFYDSQWTKKTSDGLIWLIRAFYNDDSRSLQLIGRIPGTEWNDEY